MTSDPSRIVYLNGAYLPEAEAKVSIFDRGYLMADAVYEYTAVIDGKLLEFDAHIARLQRSLDELQIDMQVDRDALLEMHRSLISRNAIDVGGVYLQVSRGVADRDFVFPQSCEPTVMAFTQRLNFLDHPAIHSGLKVISVEDGRWARPDIKTTQLLYTSMVKTQAQQRGAHDAIFVKDGYVTEATSANLFIVKDGRLITHPGTRDILHGVTRRAILALAEDLDIPLETRPFTLEEAQSADEVFMTASPLYVLPVTTIDGVPVAQAVPGAMAGNLRARFLDAARSSAV